MKHTDIESLLRDSRPQLQDNPTFLLEVQQKMRAVEGIKNEVDRQRRYGRCALILTLFFGLILGAVAMSLVYLYPIDTTASSNSILYAIRLFLDSHKHYLLLPIAGCAITLGIIMGRQKDPLMNL